MNRTTWAVAAAAVLGVTGLAGGLIAASASGHPPPAAKGTSTNTATVQRGPLANMVSGAGTLTYGAGADGAPLALVNRASGTYTALPAAGDEVDCGKVLYRVDDRPVMLLCGTVPSYRDLRQGDGGSDVRQLNQNLHQLGYDAGAGIDPNDDQFTSKTEAAVKALQLQQGLAATGLLRIDDVVFLPWPVHIAAVSADIGGIAEPGAALARVTSDTLEVQVELDVTEREAVDVGDPVQITLPGSTSTSGKVDRLGRIAKTPDAPNGSGGGATIGAHVRLDRPADARGLDTAPVEVQIRTKGVDDALSVPVTAIFGKSGGGFAVEVVRDDGRRDLVAVTLGLFDTTAGRVQVEGGVREGDRVVVPSS